ncbi:MAG: tetratricopeptide repeat protein [Myxococcota bacterium]
MAFACSVLASSSASAQSEADLSEARAWYAEGVAQAQGGDHEAAAMNFRRVLRVRESAPARYNLAFSLFELNMLQQADESVGRLLEAADTPEDIRRFAADLRLHIEAAGARLTINVRGAEPGTYDLQLDGRSVRRRDVGRPLRVRAGTHVVTVMRGGEELTTRIFDVTQGEEEGVTLIVAPTPERVAASSLAPDLPEEPRRPVVTTWQFWAVAAAVVVVGVTVGVVASQVGGSGGDAARLDTGSTEAGVIRF